MHTLHRTRIVTSVIVLIVAAMACTLPTATPQDMTPTATVHSGLQATLPAPAGTATPAAGASVGSTGGSQGSTGGNNSGTSGNQSNTNGGNVSSNASSNEGTPTQLPDINARPYVVKQIETLGGEAISGVVCSLTKPFSVLSVTPHVTFSFYFVPQNAQQGKVAYAYSIPSAGESHDAAGRYSLTPVDKAGTLQLSLTVSDHVVFKGFDGNIPNQYKFNLVPSDDASCPSAP